MKHISQRSSKSYLMRSYFFRNKAAIPSQMRLSGTCGFLFLYSSVNRSFSFCVSTDCNLCTQKRIDGSRIKKFPFSGGRILIACKTSFKLPDHYSGTYFCDIFYIRILFLMLLRTTHLRLVSRSIMVNLYLHSPICLHGSVLN
jgi:hypothetical protein